MTPLAELLRDEIRREGPISFHRFMDAALYHPDFGYYRKPTSAPFGKHGDFFTAEQMQPVFGILIASVVRRLFHEMGSPADFQVVELGAGRAEMAPALREFHYLPVETREAEFPGALRGVVFSNEFFDALPVHRAIKREGVVREMLVGRTEEAFIWVEGDRAAPELESWVERYLPNLAEGQPIEIGLEALAWMERIARSLQEGYVLTIDYGYTSRELPRFPAGTLMSYRRHSAIEDVLRDPGGQDITAHVCFTALGEFGGQVGLRTVRFENLAQTLLSAGEEDQFAAALGGAPERRGQLKTLLFGMGESFRTLLQRREQK
ncbi:MAG: SAM-dependent methyltransferase [Bryobacteraceae bacterium]